MVTCLVNIGVVVSVSVRVVSGWLPSLVTSPPLLNCCFSFEVTMT